MSKNQEKYQPTESDQRLDIKIYQVPNIVWKFNIFKGDAEYY